METDCNFTTLCQLFQVLALCLRKSLKTSCCLLSFQELPLGVIGAFCVKARAISTILTKISEVKFWQQSLFGHEHPEVRYRKIPISPGLIFVQKAFLLGLFSGKLIFGGAYYWREFCISKWVRLNNKNSYH